MPALATYSLGTEPVGSSILHDPPTVATTAPTGTITAGGPTVTAQWTFSQPQGDDQEWYRVRFTNDAGTTEYYDSGWLSGTDTSLVVDLVAEGVPTDSTDVTVHTYGRGPEAIGTGTVARYEATDSEPFAIEWGVPHCTVTSPTAGQIITTTSITPAWTFSDDRGGKTQSAFRVQLLEADSGIELHDSGWTVSGATSYAVPLLLRDLSSYELQIQLRNNHGVESD